MEKGWFKSNGGRKEITWTNFQGTILSLLYTIHYNYTPLIIPVVLQTHYKPRHTIIVIVIL